MDYAQALRFTSEPVWTKLLVTEKRDALQAIESYIAQFEGRKERTILIENMGEGYYGYYNHGDSSHIHISPYALRTPEEAVKTTLHEGRHAYQHDCLDKNAGFPQPILDQFREGFDNYINPEENFKAYASNFTEVDAEDYAEKQYKLLELERGAIMHRSEFSSHYDYSSPTSASPESETLEEHTKAISGDAVRGYDWENQTTFPELGREAEKVKGRSETETLVTSLREMPMSTQDFHQYYEYFMSDDVGHRPPAIRDRLMSNLNGMAFSLHRGDEVGYYDSRNQFLETDALYRTIEQIQGENKHIDGHVFNARKANVASEDHDLQAERGKAVSGAWAKETERVKNGRGTWDWSVEQQAELLDTGRVSGFEGSHMLSAKDYPEHAGNPDNIQLLPTIAHYDGVHERNPRGNTPNGIYNPFTGEVTPIEDGRIPPLPEFELTNQYDPSQKEFHDAHPEFEQSGTSRRQGFKDTKERHPEKSLNSHSASGEEAGLEANELANRQPGIDMSPDVTFREGATAEAEMNMMPSETVHSKQEAYRTPSLNMAPSGLKEHNLATHSESNMAPQAYEAASAFVQKDAEMNMAPDRSDGQGVESRPGIDHSVEYNSEIDTDHSKATESAKHENATQNHQSVGESPSQEQELSW